MLKLRKPILVVLVLFLVSQSAAELDAEIATSCDIDYEPVISMADPGSETSNPGEPGLYEYNLCVKGIEESTFSTSCSKNTGFYISSKDRDAHFSTQNSYSWHVCTGRMKTRVTTGAKYSNETTLFSVSDKHNGHVAEPGFYEYNVYGVYAAPENVTLSIDFNLSSSDTVYFDDERVNGESTFYPPAEFPALVAESGSYTSGIVSRSFLRASRGIEGSNSFSMTDAGQSSFVLPLTPSDHTQIEQKQDEVLDGDFFNAISPNFGFTDVEEPLVRVMLKRSDMGSDLSLAPGTYRINVTKTGENMVELVRTE